MANKRWNELSPRTRRLIVLGATVDGGLRIAALIDLVRRPAGEVRGSKARWGAAVALISSAGIVPAAYFRFGRTRRPA